MTTEDQEMFYFDVRKINWQSYLENYILGIRQFTLKDDPTTLPTARTNLKRWLKWIVPQPPGDASVFVRTINLPFVSETLTESHAESNLAYNFTWPNNVTTWVETAVQCRPLLAVPIRLSAARLISCKNTSELPAGERCDRVKLSCSNCSICSIEKLGNKHQGKGQDRSPATSTYRKKKASFYGLEARGDHYAKRVMQWCRAIGCFVDFWVDHWCADAPGYGGYQTATPPPYYTTANATTSYYTEVAQLGFVVVLVVCVCPCILQCRLGGLDMREDDARPPSGRLYNISPP
ncbi:hypothetical protein DAPPUDRAFT_114575 [Daphnia pulex]|uniref:Fatty acyl-CoA reductase C-terminal domain-containing protein n=1 Tax=Daphnia pulex TaxID=6669 RepID=E9HIL4_DAPPU|nr:hypothetical protein DAPPUDRAFT_114575 [Daphnia pulex]|eukprot:EFX68378.1 hypothetical protein DAPPUDRAFT_114575 [Daphnia pulex]